jgi:Mg-chelatase subunit ChlD
MTVEDCYSAPEAATRTIDPCPEPTPSATPSSATLALVLVLDRSGSMDGQPLEMAKKAAIAAVDRLRAGDSLAVIAFDSQPTYAVPIGPVSKASATQKIRLIQAGGGTEIFSALDAAYQKLVITRANRKHIVLLTDGQAPNNGIRDLAMAIRTEGITITTIALGPSADNELLLKIAALACGRNVPVDDPKKLPAIFANEVNAARQ